MSDETPPPPFRLKPRQRSESETPAADEGKLRLKPKLGESAAESTSDALVDPGAQTIPPTIEQARSKPKLTIEPEPQPEPEPEPVAEEPPPVDVPPEPPVEELPPPPMPEEGRFKLKIKLPGAVAQDATIPPTEEVEEPSLPPFPVVAPPPPEGEEMDAPPVLPPVVAPRTPAPFPGGSTPPGGSRPAVFKRPRVPAALLAAERRKRMWKYALIAVGGIILAGAVIFGAFLKFTEPPPPTRVPPKPMHVPAPEPVVVAPTPTKPAPTMETPLPEPGAGTRVATTATIELAPGVTATTESIKAVPNASSAFKQFVASAKISGVYQGVPPRAFINGRLVHTGEMIDDALEIYFDSVDVPARSLVFKDSGGATVSRRY